MELSTDDYIAIQQLYARYAFAFDLRDVDAWLACYTEDGELAFAHGTTVELPSQRGRNKSTEAPARVTSGRPALRALAIAAMSRPEAKGYHWNSNLVITPSETGASGQCYLMFVRSPDGLGSIYQALHYRDQLIKCREEWLFKRRTIYPLPYDYVAAEPVS